MRFSLSLIGAALVSFVLAKDNAFAIPASGNFIGLKAGGSQTFTWTNLAGSTVTLKLRSGSNGDLDAGTTIADHIKNTGSFTWSIPSTQVEGADYAIEIINDDNTAESENNYTPQFVISSPVKAVPSVSSAASSSGATASASASANASGSTGTATASATGTISTAASNSTVSSGTSTKTGSPSKTSTSSSSTASVSVPATNAANGLKAGGALVALAAGVAILL